MHQVSYSDTIISTRFGIIDIEWEKGPGIVDGNTSPQLYIYIYSMDTTVKGMAAVISASSFCAPEDYIDDTYRHTQNRFYMRFILHTRDWKILLLNYWFGHSREWCVFPPFTSIFLGKTLTMAMAQDQFIRLICDNQKCVLYRHFNAHRALCICVDE